MMTDMDDRTIVKRQRTVPTLLETDRDGWETRRIDVAAVEVEERLRAARGWRAFLLRLAGVR